MKALLVIALFVPLVALAQILGILVNSRSTSSVTGRLVWVCTYQVGNQHTEVTLDYMCPPSMQFR